jgi:hypothetical protein
MYFSQEEMMQTLAFWKPDYNPPTAIQRTPSLGVLSATSDTSDISDISALSSTSSGAHETTSVSDSSSAFLHILSFLIIFLASHGHMVTIAMLYTLLEKGGRGMKPVSKKKTLAKFDFIRLTEISRSAFITEFLRVHDLHDQFSAGMLRGPSFKLWWTGSRYVLLRYYFFDSDDVLVVGRRVLQQLTPIMTTKLLQKLSPRKRRILVKSPLSLTLIQWKVFV